MVSRDRGSISGLVVCLVMACMAVAGLSLEGGRMVHAYGALASLSASTARVGGQEISGIQDGSIHIDHTRALAAMRRYLQVHQEKGEFQIGTTSISVTLRRTVSTGFLKILGIPSRTVSVTRTVIVQKG